MIQAIHQMRERQQTLMQVCHEFHLILMTTTKISILELGIIIEL
jgi:hypothetical protein